MLNSPAIAAAQGAHVAVLRIRNLVIGQGEPKTIVATTGSTSDEVRRQARRIADNSNADVIEYRIDYNFALDAGFVAALGKQVAEIMSGKPIILTFRTKAEGGSKPVSDDAYGKLYSALIKAVFIDLLDVEMFRDDQVVRRVVGEAHKSE